MYVRTFNIVALNLSHRKIRFSSCGTLSHPCSCNQLKEYEESYRNTSSLCGILLRLCTKPILTGRKKKVNRYSTCDQDGAKEKNRLNRIMCLSCGKRWEGVSFPSICRKMGQCIEHGYKRYCTTRKGKQKQYEQGIK